MARLTVSLFILLSQVAFSQAGEPAKIVLDLWDAAYLQNYRAGYVRTFTQEIDQGDRKLLRTTVELRLTIKRNTDVIQLSMDTGTLETSAGKVTGVFLRQFLGKNQTLDLAGTVVGEQLHLKMNGKPLKPAPWDERVVGLYRQQKLFQDKDLKPGDEFTYLSFEPSINLVVKNFVKVKDYREVEFFAGKQTRRLLRVDTQPEKIEKVQLPTLVTWLGEDRTSERSEVEIPGLGNIVLYRTSKSLATAPGPVASLTDVGLSHMVRLSRRIVQPYDTSAAVYRITIRNEDDPGSAFSRDTRQQVKNVRGNSLELHIRAGGEVETIGEEKIGAEFTQSCYFINSNDALVQDHAKKAVGLEKDPWKKALRIEKWVHANMRNKNHEALATADHVARTLEGDCTEYAMLMAAMCRASGVPSRTAVGLVYADVKGAPVFAFHMWTEVFARGQWVPLDATLGRGKVGATHLKITDQSWHDTRTMTPLFPVVRVLGRVAIEVLTVESAPER